MYARDARFVVVANDAKPLSHGAPITVRHLTIAVVLIGIVAAGAVLEQAPRSVLPVSSADLHVQPAPAATQEIDYYPARLKNQAQGSQPEEHIQAF